MKFSTWPGNENVRLHKGHVDIYQTKRGAIVARAWPRKGRPPPSQAQLVARYRFASAIQNAKLADARAVDAAIQYVKGTGWMPRDLLESANMGKAMQWVTKAGVARNIR